MTQTPQDAASPEQQTWTFVGHWANDVIVVEYVLDGEQQDLRVDNGYWEQGLFAEAATAATQDEALQQIRAHYEQHDDDDDDDDVRDELLPDPAVVARLRAANIGRPADPAGIRFLTTPEAELVALELEEYIQHREHLAWENGHTGGLNNASAPEGGEFVANPHPHMGAGAAAVPGEPVPFPVAQLFTHEQLMDKLDRLEGIVNEVSALAYTAQRAALASLSRTQDGSPLGASVPLPELFTALRRNPGQS
jgi:hypothetical protein